jgi:hypothetical protein
MAVTAVAKAAAAMMIDPPDESSMLASEHS